MHVYFIRHGETLHNRKHLHQRTMTPLTEGGKEQARAVARALMDVPQPILLTSPLTRARETAEIVSKMIGATPREEPLFSEVKRPAQVIDKPYYGFESLTIGIQMVLHAPYAAWHYSDEENLYDIRTRATRAVASLEELSQRYEHVIVVSHAGFLRLLFSQLIRKKVSVFAYIRAMLKLRPLANGSITHATYTCVDEVCTWKLEQLNYRGHLRGDGTQSPRAEERA